MYVRFGRVLVALCVVGIGFGAVFGAGVVVGKGGRTAIVAASATPGAAVASGGGAGSQAVNGVIESVTPTSIVVRQNSGTMVTIAVNAQTAVRKNDAGTVQDLTAGTPVIVVPDAAMVATSVQIVAAGAGGGVGAGGGGRAGANGGGAAPSGTARGNRAGGAAPAGTPTPAR